MTKTNLKKMLLDAAWDADVYEGDETSFRHAYSGRGMYGKTCFGIVTDEPMEVLVRLALVVGLEQGRAETDCDNGEDDRAEDVDAWETLGRALGNVRTDNMGRSTIIYWPGIEGEAMEPDDYDEEE